MFSPIQKRAFKLIKGFKERQRYNRKYHFLFFSNGNTIYLYNVCKLYLGVFYDICKFNDSIVEPEYSKKLFSLVCIVLIYIYLYIIHKLNQQTLSQTALQKYEYLTCQPFPWPAHPQSLLVQVDQTI